MYMSWLVGGSCFVHMAIPAVQSSACKRVSGLKRYGFTVLESVIMRKKGHGQLHGN